MGDTSKGVANKLHPAKKIYKKESVLQDPAQFSTACSALLAFHQSAIRDGQGEHLVFLGEGTSGEVRTRIRRTNVADTGCLSWIPDSGS